MTKRARSTSGGKYRRPGRPRIRRLFFEPLEVRRVLADLRITGVQLIEPDRVNTPVTPIIGQEVCVKASFSTSGLPVGSSYRVEYVVDGVAQSHTLTSGAGVTSGNYYGFRCGWYATPEQHVVERVTLDADNSVVESDEGNNVSTPNLNFTPVSPPNLSQKFFNPMGGALGRDWRVNNYHDVDRTSGTFKDFRGGIYSYDGHEADDISLPSFNRMDMGIPIYAAGAGTVSSMADGNFDRNDERGSRPANFVTLDHGNGWQTIYYHFATNTITVRQGDVVTDGQLLGLAGSSGDSNGAHLHFGIRHYGGAIEPNYEPQSFYAQPLPYQADQPTTALDMGITNFSPSDADMRERPAEASVFSTQASKPVVAWFRFSNSKAGDQYQFRWYRPSGQLASTNTATSSVDGRGGWFFFSRASSLYAGSPGIWRVAIEKNGVELASRTFEVVTSAGTAEIKVTAADATIISDNRTTAFDFGSAALSGVPPTQTFTLANHGTAALQLSNLRLPPGFELVGSLPTSISAGSSATLTFRLATTVVGTKFGAVEFTTNDPDTPRFNFNVAGVVNGAAPSTAPVITLGGQATVAASLAPAVAVQLAATIADSDSANFDGGSLRVEFASFSAAADVLMVLHQGQAAGQIGTSGTQVTWGGITIGSYVGGTLGAPLVISLNSAATVPAVTAVARAIAFRTTALKPETLARFIRFTLTDGSGNQSNQPIALVVQNLLATTVSMNGDDLVLTDSSVAGKNDRWRIERDGDRFELTDLTGNVIDAASIPAATGSGTSSISLPWSLLSASARLLVDSHDGLDQLTVVPAQGNPVPGGGITLASGTALIAATPVNQLPTIDPISALVLLEDAAPQTIALAGIAAGPGESQELQLTTSVNSPLVENLQADYASPSASGELTFAVQPNRSGQAQITVQLRDNGGTLSGGLDETSRTIPITVLPVNDAPDFAVQSFRESSDASGPQLVEDWATSITPGAADETDQELEFEIVSNSNPSLFAAEPEIDDNGVLSYQPMPNAHGNASIAVRLKDDGGVEHGGQHLSDEKTFEIKIIKPYPWHNTRHALDVTGKDGVPDQKVTAGDALAIINYINAFGQVKVPAGAAPGAPYLDTVSRTTGKADNFVSAGDALAVINFINGFGSALPGPDGESLAFSESPASRRVPSELEIILAHDLATQPKRRRF